MTWEGEKKQNAINIILDSIASGQSLISIIRERSREEVPSRSLFNKWLSEDKELADKYARACEDRQELIFDEIFDIADESSNDYICSGIPMPTSEGAITFSDYKFNAENVQRSRLRIDARKWALSKMNPKKYGDKVDVTSGDMPIKQMPMEITIVKPADDEE